MVREVRLVLAGGGWDNRLYVFWNASQESPCFFLTIVSCKKKDFLSVYKVKWGYFVWRLHTLKVVLFYFHVECQ